jgi:sec-independent protein translocase protein TatA
MGISFWHIVIVVLVVVLLFGAGKIPRLMKDLGSGITAFKKGLKENEGGSAAAEPGAGTPAQPAQLQTAQTASAEKKPDEVKKA